MVRGLSGCPAWARRSPSCLTVCMSPPRAGRSGPIVGTWTGLPQPALGPGAFVGGQDLDGIRQWGAQIGRVLGPDLAADVPLSWGYVEPEVGFEPTTFRLRDGCSASIWTAPDGSSLLTLDGPSVQTDPDGSRRIVWMIRWMIKGHPTTYRMARQAALDPPPYLLASIRPTALTRCWPLPQP